ncbi:hypothetical protein VXM60_12035 [Shewanella khirikhana]|uniref:hypothetical protein n=1 Tax=Shewanella khirikhana TaxID=1965282 RepID=UPI0030D147A4
MPKEYFYPDVKEPHIHHHKGGITFTDIGHSHRTLVSGSKDYHGVIREVIADLQRRGDSRSLDIVQHIRNQVA